MKKTLTQNFIEELSRTKNAELFVGVARLLKVSIIDEEMNTRDFNDVFTDILAAFDKSKNKFKKELLKILKDANSCKEGGLSGHTKEKD